MIHRFWNELEEDEEEIEPILTVERRTKAIENRFNETSVQCRLQLDRANEFYKNKSAFMSLNCPPVA